jgi:hypothetical protein
MTTLAPMFTGRYYLRTHLHEGAIYKDRSDNVIRLLSIRGDYCVYVYVSLTSLRSSMHGSVTGLTKKNVFVADFVFVADSQEDWTGRQRKHSNGGADASDVSLPAVQAMSSRAEQGDWPVRLGIVPRSSRSEDSVRRAS